jgi:hypothetical protein
VQDLIILRAVVVVVETMQEHKVKPDWAVAEPMAD